MKDKGMKGEQINTILIENPKKLLTFKQVLNYNAFLLTELV